jgi:AcrR family transcriptional regulator
MTTKTPKARDRRVERTRHTLREALIAILQERDWENVSVQDVCDRANVGRSTFYTHFADKEDLLIGGLDDLRSALRRHPPSAERLLFARGLIRHANEQRRLFRALVGKHGGEAVLRRFREFVLDLVRDDLAGLGPGGEQPEATAQFVAGGVVQLLAWWLESRPKLEPEEVEKLVVALAGGALKAGGLEP